VSIRLDESAVVWSAPEAERAGRPLLLGFHGHHGDEHQLAIAAQVLPRRVVVATPRAPYLEPGGWSWFELAEPGRQQAADAVEAVLGWLDRQPRFSSIGLLGLSQGSAMALALLRRDPSRFDYVAQLSGFAIDTSPAPDVARLRPPAFSAHGDLDTVIPKERVDDTARWLREHTTLTERRYPQLGHSVDPLELLDAAAFLTAQAR
jgi:phospholipase/carboxylesterase